jgi:hypothetical protein
MFSSEDKDSHVVAMACLENISFKANEPFILFLRYWTWQEDYNIWEDYSKKYSIDINIPVSSHTLGSMFRGLIQRFKGNYELTTICADLFIHSTLRQTICLPESECILQHFIQRKKLNEYNKCEEIGTTSESV